MSGNMPSLLSLEARGSDNCNIERHNTLNHTCGIELAHTFGRLHHHGNLISYLSIEITPSIPQSLHTRIMLLSATAPILIANAIRKLT